VCCTVQSDGEEETLEGKNPRPEQEWEPMRLTLLGKVGDVVRVGMGKLSSVLVDPGEPKKTQPSG
jgi:hypothetical protein